MTTKDELVTGAWRRGVLFACIQLRNQMPFCNSEMKDEIQYILRQAEISKEAISKLLIQYEEEDTIDDLISIL